MLQPLPFRSPAKRLRDAREDHARCLGLASWYRELCRRGEPDARERHAWAMSHARTLRDRHVGLSAPRASPG